MPTYEEGDDDDSIAFSESNGNTPNAAMVQIVLSFIDWICGQLRKSSDEPSEIIIHALAVLLYDRGVRPAVVRGKIENDLS